MTLTLAQMLALLPLNTTGEISPSDLRAVVTALSETATGARTLVYEDPLTSTTNITTDAGTVTYDSGEGAVDAGVSSRFRWTDSAVDVTNLGANWEATIDVRPKGEAIFNPLSFYSNTGWQGYLHRYEFRTGARNHGMYKVTGGGAASGIGLTGFGATAYRASGTPGYMRVGWGLSNNGLFLRQHIWGQPQLLAGLGTDTSFTTGTLGINVESPAACFVKNFKVYTYTATP